jgi:hypothetical protein
VITQALLSFVFAIVNGLLGLLPTSGPPTWWADTASAVAQVWSYGTQLGAWIPWNVAAVCVPAVFAAIGVGFGIKLVRIVVSLFTGGGGSAA